MNIASLIARYLLGVIFVVFGLNGFFNFLPMPPQSGVAGQFMGALVQSNYIVLVFLLQLIAGIMLLANRFVPLALTLLAPVIVNIFLFHATMAPSGLPPAVIIIILWILVFLGVRSSFARLFESRATA